MGIELGGTTQPTTQLGGLNFQQPTSSPSVGGGLSLTKGGRLDLTKGNPGLDKIRVGLGWDINHAGGADFDLDVVVFMLGENNKVISSSHVVYFNNLTSPDGAVVHQGDNRTGLGEGDDETILVQLSKVSPEVQRIVFTVSIYEANARRQNFGQVNNAYIRVVNEANGQEICRYDLTEDYSTSISVKVGEVYRHNGEWKFYAKGEGSTADLAGLCIEYGAM
jgi:stress response protein SCP2